MLQDYIINSRGKVDEERAHQKIGGASVINRGEQRYFDNFKQNQFRFASYSDPAIQNDLNYRDELKDEEKDSNISIVENQLRFNERPSHLDYRLEDSANEKEQSDDRSKFDTKNNKEYQVEFCFMRFLKMLIYHIGFFFTGILTVACILIVDGYTI